jgi:hypothetical protein
MTRKYRLRVTQEVPLTEIVFSGEGEIAHVSLAVCLRPVRS